MSQNPLFEDLNSLLQRGVEEPDSIEEANTIIQAICTLRGGVPDELQRELFGATPKLQGFVSSLVRRAQRSEEKFVKIVADGLYSQNVRVLYELIQNADDASYSDGQSPELSFSISSKELHVDSNEDGFTLANVVAICSTAESSKMRSSTATSIGEKGVGFKSVFKVAHYVSIQSGYWRFGFKYDPRDPMTMIRPIVETKEKRPPGIMTRISLHCKLERALALLKELKSLPDTAIVFLRKINRISVSAADFSKAGMNFTGRKLSRSISSIRSTERRLHKRFDLVTVKTKINTQDGNYVTRTKLFRLFKKTYDDMPEEEKRPGLDTSEIQLAFPVESVDGSARISDEGEYIFAFLPMAKQKHLPADFVTTMSREDVIVCDWNTALRDRVSVTFVEAVKLFILHENFVFEWLRYLPSKELGEFWPDLQKSILAYLSEVEYLLLRTGDTASRRFATPFAVKLLPHAFVFEDAPLLPDTEKPTVYLADEYRTNNLEDKLRLVGVKLLPWYEILDRIEEDLKYEDSLIQTTKLDSDFHITFMNLLSKILEVASDKDRHGLKKYLCSLPVVPLQNGRWACPKDDIYNHAVEKQPIPTNLGFKLLHPIVSRTGEQQVFYKSLGVTDCKSEDVCEAIFRKHRYPQKWLDKTKPHTLVSHLQFLHRHTSDMSPAKCRDLFIATTELNIVPASKGLYFQSSMEYDTQQLLKSVSPAIIRKKSFDTDIFLHDQYSKHDKPEKPRHGFTWPDWLESKIAVRRYPPLRKSPDELSDILALVLESDSATFLGTLQRHWKDSYEAESNPSKYPRLLEALKQIGVFCTNDEQGQLQDTLFPTKEVLEMRRELHMENELPFIRLPTEPTAEDDWIFLTRFGVTFKTDLKFFLASAYFIRNVSSRTEDQLLETLVKIYENIASRTMAENGEWIKDTFSEADLIYLPKDMKPRSPKNCIWHGPDFLDKYPPLKTFYGQSEAIEYLFIKRLGIRNATWRDVFDQLLEWKAKSEAPDSEFVICESTRWDSPVAMFTDVYKSIASLTPKKDMDQMRTLMEEQCLVYARGSWLKPSQCIWNAAVDLSGKTKIGPLYRELESFFVGTLAIQTDTAPLFLEEWCNIAKAHTGTVPIEAVRNIQEIMVQLGLLVDADEFHDLDLFHKNLADLVAMKCLPVTRPPDTEVTLCAPRDVFYINDHPRYSGLFSGHLEILNMDLNDCWRLEKLFSMIGIENRFLSEHVSETSSAPEVSELQPSLTADFRCRAYALAWYAAKFGSRKFLSGNTATYERLLAAEVHLSDSLKSHAHMELVGRAPLSVESDRIVAQIEDDDSDNLKIYLPAEEGARRLSYRKQLPSLLRSVLGIPLQANYQTLLLMLLLEKLSRLTHFLDDWDVMPLSWIPAPPVEAHHWLENSHERDLMANEFTPSTRDRAEFTLPFRQAQGSHHLSRTPSPFPSSRASAPNNDEYVRLLQNVQRVAQGEPATGDTFEPIDPVKAFGDQSDSFEYRAKIGAAGELLVYELLCAEGLENWDYDNWPSRIRHLVQVHPDYSDLFTWKGKDIDITYTDRHGQLEDWLYDHNSGFGDDSDLDDPNREASTDDSSRNDSDSVANSNNESNNNVNNNNSSNNSQDLVIAATNEEGEVTPITFIIEVKTTTMGLNDRMFMSNAQYERMHKLAIVSGTRPKEIFVLVRVYDLLQQTPRYKVYVDPSRLKGTLLTFKPHQWMVKVNA